MPGALRLNKLTMTGAVIAQDRISMKHAIRYSMDDNVSFLLVKWYKANILQGNPTMKQTLRAKPIRESYTLY